jgi:hypothetical protein
MTSTRMPGAAARSGDRLRYLAHHAELSALRASLSTGP